MVAGGHKLPPGTIWQVDSVNSNGALLRVEDNPQLTMWLSNPEWKGQLFERARMRKKPAQ